MSTGTGATYGSPPRPPTGPPPPARRSHHGLLIAGGVTLGVVAMGVAGFVALAVIGAVMDAQHTRSTAAAKAARQQQIASCRARIGTFVESVRDIDAQLDIGLTQSALSEAAGKASINRSRIDTGALSPACLYAYHEADEALTTYAGTVSEWNDCIWSDDDCDPDSDLDLQTPWAEAKTHITEAYSAMSSGRSGPGTDS